MKYFIKEFDTRFFAGIETPNGINNKDDLKRIPQVWEELFDKYMEIIPNQAKPKHFIGLECYPFDFAETGSYDYYAMVETSGLIAPPEGVVTKKLKAGKYICFTIPFDDISNEIHRAYRFVKAEKIKIHMGFDYEDYLPDQNYQEAGALLNFCLLLEDDIK